MAGEPNSHRDARGHETGVLRGLMWIFLAMGGGALLLFLLEPDIHAHPELILMSGTSLLGALSLRALQSMLGPTSDYDVE